MKNAPQVMRKVRKMSVLEIRRRSMFSSRNLVNSLRFLSSRDGSGGVVWYSVG